MNLDLNLITPEFGIGFDLLTHNAIDFHWLRQIQSCWIRIRIQEN